MRIFIMMIVAAAAHAATPRNLGFTTSAQTLGINNCSTVVEVQTQDYAFNPTNETSATTLTPSGSFSFYSDAACTSSISTVTVPANSSTARFYFKASTTGAQVMSVSGPSLSSASQTETLNSSSTSTCVTPPSPPNICEP